MPAERAGRPSELPARSCAGEVRRPRWQLLPSHHRRTGSSRNCASAVLHDHAATDRAAGGSASFVPLLACGKPAAFPSRTLAETKGERRQDEQVEQRRRDQSANDDDRQQVLDLVTRDGASDHERNRR